MSDPTLAYRPSITGYGAEYEKRISKARALQLVYHLPPMGCQRTLRKVPFLLGQTHYDYLVLQNIGGIYVLASHTTKRSEWADVFGEKWSDA